MLDRDARIGLTVFLFSVTVALVVVLFAATARPRAAGAAAVAPTCLEWTDGCVVCRRDAAGAAADCSLPGIACVRAAPRCVRP